MIYFIIYLTFVFVFLYADALICIATKHRFDFWSSIVVCIFFPFTLPVIIYMASKVTSNLPEAGELLSEVEKENEA